MAARHGPLFRTVVLLIGLSAGGLSAAEPVDPSRAFLTRHCLECHSGTKAKAGVRLDTLTADFTVKAERERWHAVLEQAGSGNMPPAKKPRVPKPELAALENWITARLTAAEAARTAVVGRTGTRRLNRTEYSNTVRDLLGVNVNVTDLLPDDPADGGFDNSAEALHVSSFLMEQYLEAADRVLNAAIVNAPKPWMVKKRFSIKDEKSVRPNGSVYRHTDDGVVIFSSWVSANIQVTLWQFFSHFSGNYRIRSSDRSSCRYVWINKIENCIRRRRYRK